jgi:hypothetical protein
MIESSIVLYEHNENDNEIVTVDLGGPASVEFDFFKLWNFRKNLGDKFDPRRFRFYHVHPSGMLTYSDTDLNCVRGFNIAFGRDVWYFSIITFDSPNINDINHKQISYTYRDGELVKFLDLRLDKHMLLLLKVLSYGEVQSHD